MNKKKQERLEANGWVIGGAEDFLELTEQEMRDIEKGIERKRAIEKQQIESRLGLKPKK